MHPRFLSILNDLVSHNFLAWCISAVCLLVALDTVLRLWTERHRLAKEELYDEDRAFVWKIVVSLVLPLITWMDFRATDIAVQHAGGFLDRISYGLIWYQCEIHGLSQNLSPLALTTINFAGEIVQILFALALITVLCVRPHPFLATLTGYTIAFTLGLNLVVEPLLHLSGLEMQRFQVIETAHGPYLYPFYVQAVLSLIYIAALTSPFVRKWFSSLTRPHLSSELEQCLKEWKGNESEAEISLRLGLLYVRAGLSRQARVVLKKMRKSHPGSVYTTFLGAVLAFHKRNYKEAKQAFIKTADSLDNFAQTEELRGNLLAAAACAAFAHQDISGSLNLADRALEFAESLTARMVKVDAYLAQGKKEQAAQEILVAIHLGLDFDLKDSVPINVEEAYQALTRINLTADERELPAEVQAR